MSTVWMLPELLSRLTGYRVTVDGQGGYLDIRRPDGTEIDWQRFSWELELLLKKGDTRMMKGESP